MENDEPYLRRAIRLAMNGRGRVEPNPMVGCVLVKNGRIIGEGNHAQYGGPHAEPTALANCTESPEGATAYVTLEPCCHTNKQTPPCAPKLIAAKIARVVVGCLDPNPDVNGKGVQMLREAGIQVDGPLLEAECKQLIAAFIKRQENLYWPYVTLKWAQSTNRKIAGRNGRPVQITNPLSSRLVHILRSRCDAITVGINTVLRDDPMLTVRGVPSPRKLRRSVLDSTLRIPISSKLVQTATEITTRVYCNTGELDSEKAKMLRSKGVDLTDLDTVDVAKNNGDFRLSLSEMMLSEEGSHLLIEPGPTLAVGCFEQNIADRLWVFTSPNSIYEGEAVSAADIPATFVVTGELNIGGDILVEYLNTKARGYFASVPSADFILACESPPLAASRIDSR